MNHIEVLLVTGFGAAVAMFYRHTSKEQLRQDLEKLEYMDRNIERVRPPATMTERQTLANELYLQKEALKRWWPRRSPRIQWEDLPMDESFRIWFDHRA